MATTYTCRPCSADDACMLQLPLPSMLTCFVIFCLVAVGVEDRVLSGPCMLLSRLSPAGLMVPGDSGMPPAPSAAPAAALSMPPSTPPDVAASRAGNNAVIVERRVTL